MLKNYLIITLMTLLVSIFSYAQILGTVINDSSQPLLGVSIMVKGTTKGVISDFDGNYKIDAK